MEKRLIRSRAVRLLVLTAVLGGARAEAQIHQDLAVRFGGLGEDVVFIGTVDASGHAYLLGTTTSFGVLGEGVLLAKIGAGGALDWMRTWDAGPGEDEIEGFTVESSGRFVASGSLDGIGPDDDGFVLAYDGAIPGWSGAHAWARRWDSGNGDDSLDGVAAHFDGGTEYLFVAGETAAPLPALFGSDLLLQRHDLSGNLVSSVAWAAAGSSWTFEGANAVVHDPVNDVLYAAGHYWDVGGSSGTDALLVQVLTAGGVSWAQTLDFRGSCDDAFSVAVHGGDVYIAGATDGRSDCTRDVDPEIFLAKFDSNGARLWDLVYSSDRSLDGVGVLVDPGTGDVYVSAEEQLPGGNWDALILAFDPGGGLLWSRTWGGLGDDGLAHGWSATGLVGFGATASCGGVLRSCGSGTLDYDRGTVSPLSGSATALPGTSSDFTALDTVPRTSTPCSAFDAVYVTFQSADIGAPYCFGDGTGTPCPCANPGCAREGCRNSSVWNRGAALQARGSASIAASDLVLVASGAISNQPGLFFQAHNATNGGAGLVFGDGLRCAGGSVVRLQIAVVDGAGDAQSSTSIVSTGGVGVGDLRRYQFWYRDPVGSPCGTAFNLTNGLEILWQP